MTGVPLLHFPFPAPPEPGGLAEVAPGLFWVRLALPFRFDHVNVYPVEDGPGYAATDTGIGDAPTREAWAGLLDRFLRSRPLTRVIVTHFHSDHAGMAGWLCEHLGVALLMSQTEYLTSLTLLLDPAALDAEPYRGFFRGEGLDAESRRYSFGVLSA